MPAGGRAGGGHRVVQDHRRAERSRGHADLAVRVEAAAGADGRVLLGHRAVRRRRGARAGRGDARPRGHVTPPRDPGRVGAHSTAAEAGEIAARAGVRRLILTHIDATHHDEVSALAVEARARFPGEVEIAEELVPYPL